MDEQVPSQENPINSADIVGLNSAALNTIFKYTSAHGPVTIASGLPGSRLRKQNRKKERNNRKSGRNQHK